MGSKKKAKKKVAKKKTKKVAKRKPAKKKKAVGKKTKRKAKPRKKNVSASASITQAAPIAEAKAADEMAKVPAGAVETHDEMQHAGEDDVDSVGMDDEDFDPEGMDEEDLGGIDTQ